MCVCVQCYYSCAYTHPHTHTHTILHENPTLNLLSCKLTSPLQLGRVLTNQNCERPMLLTTKKNIDVTMRFWNLLSEAEELQPGAQSHEPAIVPRNAFDLEG